MNASRQKRTGRSAKGNSLTEFGPGLIILFMFFFFPLIDLISVVVSYAVVMVLNYNQVHEASLIPSNIATDPSGSVKSGIPAVWENGMGHFVKMTGQPTTNVSYFPGASPDQIVLVKTTVVCNPFLPVPVPMLNVPGLNGPFTFEVASQHIMENPDYVTAQPAGGP
jgi:hypothetical protein